MSELSLIISLIALAFCGDNLWTLFVKRRKATNEDDADCNGYRPRNGQEKPNSMRSALEMIGTRLWTLEDRLYAISGSVEALQNIEKQRYEKLLESAKGDTEFEDKLIEEYYELCMTEESRRKRDSLNNWIKKLQDYISQQRIITVVPSETSLDPLQFAQYEQIRKKILEYENVELKARFYNGGKIIDPKSELIFGITTTDVPGLLAATEILKPYGFTLILLESELSEFLQMNPFPKNKWDEPFMSTRWWYFKTVSDKEFEMHVGYVTGPMIASGEELLYSWSGSELNFVKVSSMWFS